MKKLLALMISFCLIFVMSACGGDNGGNTNGGEGGEQQREPVVYSEGLEFTSNGDGSCYVSGIGSCEDIKIVIPLSSPEGERVIGIGKDAFAFNDQVRFVILPESVTYIEGGAFSYCCELRYVVVCEGLQRIGDFAFYNDGALGNIYYTGSQAQWNSISIGANNDSLNSAKINCGYFQG